jgi:hypothetical protein
MDDILIFHQDRECLQLATLQIAVCLQSLGWTFTLRMTSHMRTTLLFMLDQWRHKVEKQERVSSRALNLLIGSFNLLRG